MKTINLYICLMTLFTAIGYAQVDEYGGSTPVDYALNEVVVQTHYAGSYSVPYYSLPVFTASYNSSSGSANGLTPPPDGYVAAGDAVSYYINNANNQVIIPPTPDPIKTEDLIKQQTLTPNDLLRLINNLKSYTQFNQVKTVPYAYKDYNGITHIGFLTIISNDSNDQRLLYFDELENKQTNGLFVKLPDSNNGIILHSSSNANNINTGNNSPFSYTYNAENMVMVTVSSDININVPINPDSIWMLYQNNNENGVWLEVRPKTSSNYDPIAAFYDAIPRISRSNVDMGPNSNFQQAQQLFQNNSLTLAEALFVKREYFDVVIPDYKGGIDVYMARLIDKVSSGLPDEYKPEAEEMLVAFANAETVNDTAIPSNPFDDTKDYVFDSNGNPLKAGDDGHSIKIMVNGIEKLTSELDPNDMTTRKAIAKIAVFLAKKVNAPIGSWFATGKSPKTTELSSTVPAFTLPTDPYMTVLNTRGGKYSTALDNIYSFTNILQHELGHQFNEKSSPKIPYNLSTHVDVYIDAIEKTSFKNSPPDYKLSVIASLANYIWNMDKKGYTFQQIKEKIDTFNGRSQFNGGYRLIAPKDPNNASNILFKVGELGIDNFKVYNPLTDQEVPVTFTINDEK